MWTRLNHPCWRRCGAAERTSHSGFARERIVRAPATARNSSTSLHSYYDVLGVDAAASVDDIKSAFRRQAKLVHPDVSKSADSEEDFKQLREAYDVLSDADQRAEYDEALQRALRQRSGRRAGGSGRRVVIMQDDPWGLGGSTVEVVMEGFGEDDDDDDDSDDDDEEGVDGSLEELAYMAWAATPGNMRASYQSSWQANGRKARQQAAAVAAAMQMQLTQDDKVELMQDLPPQIRAAAQHVFGAKLQKLNTLEELGAVIEAVKDMNAMGVQFEITNENAGGGRPTTRGSRRQGGGFGSPGGGARARRPGGGGGSSGTGGRRRRK